MLSSRINTILNVSRTVSQLCLMGVVFILSSPVMSAQTAQDSLTSDQAIARLSLKHVSYSQHQEEYLNAITDVLVAESKGVWKHLPNRKPEGESPELSPSEPAQNNLTLIEASLYHYFGMQDEAEKRYQKVINQSSAHLPTAYLYLTRYYYQQQDFANVLKWVGKVDETQLTEEQQGFKYLYELDAYIRLGQKKKALTSLSSLEDLEWLPILSYNSKRLVSVTPGAAKVENSDPEDSTWFGQDDEDVAPLLKELEAHKNLQMGMDASKKGHWSSAVDYFKKVPANTLRTVEARRWLAWSLMQDGQLDSASKVWRSLTSSPSYQALDSFVMSANVTEQLGDKEKALAWFEKGIDFYADQVEALSKLRNENQNGDWFGTIQSSSETFWSPVQINIEPDQPLFLWTEEVWQDEGFQQLLSDHRDLIQVSSLLESKKDYIETFDYMVENRRLGYEKTAQKIKRMEADLRLKSYQTEAQAHTRRLDSISDYKDIFSVGSKEQLINNKLLERVKANIEHLKSMEGYARKHKTTSYEARYEHLNRIHFWEMREAFPSNFRRYQREVKNLNDELQESDRALAKMKAAEVYAPSRFKGYSEKIDRLAKHIQGLVQQTHTLQDNLKSQVVSMLDRKLAERQKVAQTYLEQSILASARLRDEIAFELGHVEPDSSDARTLASNGGTH
ncbi:tetratricopeptide repeat protein [Litoribrevibacter albus]|nr:hypothetical protein [Litoribrevibacter albus]